MKKQLKVFVIFLILFGVLKLPYFFLPSLLRSQLKNIENFRVEKIDDLAVSPFLRISSTSLSSKIEIPPFSIPLDFSEISINFSPIDIFMLRISPLINTKLYGGELNGEIYYSFFNNKLISGDLKAKSINPNLNKFLSSLGISGIFDISSIFNLNEKNNEYYISANINSYNLSFKPNFLMQKSLPTLDNIVGQIQVQGETLQQSFIPNSIKINLNYFDGTLTKAKDTQIELKFKEDFKKILPEILKLNPTVAIFKDQIIKVSDKLGLVKANFLQSGDLNIDSDLAKLTGKLESNELSGKFKLVLTEAGKNEFKQFTGDSDKFLITLKQGNIVSFVQF